MNIAYITSEFITENIQGGLATYLNNISTIMSEHGHNVTIITLSDCTGRVKYKSKIEVVRVKSNCILEDNYGIKKVLGLISNSLKLYVALKKELKLKRIDIVQSANFNAVGFFRNYKVPTIVRVSSDASMLRNAKKYEFDYLKALKDKTFEDNLELWCVRQSDFAFAPSRFCASVTEHRVGKKVHVLESPYIDNSSIMDESLYLEKLENKKYLMMNSKLSILKGTHVVIKATDYLLDKYKDLYMVYAGIDQGLICKDGRFISVEEIIRKQSKKFNGRVIYLGKIEHEQLFPIVKNAFACVLPSRVDNLPNSCIEAMSLGSIVIGTNGASYEQLIKNKENGLLIKRDSTIALIKAVDYLMNINENFYMEMKENAVTSIERLSSDKVYAKTIQCYQRVIDEYKNKRNRV